MDKCEKLCNKLSLVMHFLLFYDEIEIYKQPITGTDVRKKSDASG